MQRQFEETKNEMRRDWEHREAIRRLEEEKKDVESERASRRAPEELTATLDGLAKAFMRAAKPKPDGVAKHDLPKVERYTGDDPEVDIDEFLDDCDTRASNPNTMTMERRSFCLAA